MLTTALQTGIISQALLQLINVLTFYNYELTSNEHYPTDYGPSLLDNNPQIFDFIIVGGGTAGSVLANRLSNMSKWRILVLEAGSTPSSNVEVPAFCDLTKNTEEDWYFVTNSEKFFCNGMNDKRCRIHSGKMLGGTTGLSNMHYERATHTDLKESIPKINYEEALQHYSNIENYIGNKKYYKNFGVGGEITIDDFEETESNISSLIYEAAALLDYRKILHDTQNLGYTESSGYFKSGSRFHFAKAFLAPVKYRKNLFVAQNALVTKVMVNEPTDKRVKGVEALIFGERISVTARFEVILTAGAINNAKLLMLSGIGPKDSLLKLGIPIISDKPVGKNLQDHLALPIFISVNNLNYEEDIEDAVYNFLKHKKGPLTQIKLNNLVGAINTKLDYSSIPNLRIYHRYFRMKDENLRRYLKNHGYEDAIIDCLEDHNSRNAFLVMVLTLISPKSIGKVFLHTSNPYDPPIIQGNYLGDENKEDLKNFIEGFRYVLRMVELPPLDAVEAEVLDVLIPHCRNYRCCTEKYIKCYVESLGTPMGRVSGTLRSGNDSDVTNEKLLVRGVRHLRVVDASIFRHPLSTSYEGTVAMLADKISRDIMKTWKN